MKRIACWMILATATILPACTPTVTLEHVIPGPALLDPNQPTTAVTASFDKLNVNGEILRAEWTAALLNTVETAPPWSDLYMGQVATLADAPVAGPMNIDTQLTYAIHEESGTRTIRRQSNGLVDQTVPYLTRQITLAAIFTLRRNGEGAITSIESRQAYTSLGDPRVRGELGLGRPDDPANVPPVDTILQELFLLAIDDLDAQLQPIRISAEVKLRDAGGSAGKDGLAAAKDEAYRQAVEHFQDRLTEMPSDQDTRFDLAVTAEAAGLFVESARAYREVLQSAAEEDPEAHEGLRRVRRLLDATTPPAIPHDIPLPALQPEATQKPAKVPTATWQRTPPAPEPKPEPEPAEPAPPQPATPAPQTP